MRRTKKAYSTNWQLSASENHHRIWHSSAQFLFLRGLGLETCWWCRPQTY